MISGFIAKKGTMTSVFSPDGTRTAVTQLITFPLTVSSLIGKNVQIAYGSKKNIEKALAGFLKKQKLSIKPQHFKEFALMAETAPEIGSEITADLVFKEGDIVSVSGKTKGRGFAGVIKRHGFKKQPIKNASDRIRAPGAVGAQTPSKIVKGKRMPGHYGNKTKTVSGLKIISINKEKNEILVQGSVPGVINSWVSINK